MAAYDRPRPIGPRRRALRSRREAEDGDAKPSKLEQLRARYRWLDHLVRAGARYTERHGDHYAAAITFFSVLSLVPLLMIAFAVAGLRAGLQPDLLTELRRRDQRGPSARTWPRRSTRSSTRRSSSAARSARSACWPRCTPGIGWMTNLREALSEQWAQVPEPPGAARSGCCSTCWRCSGSGSRWSARSRSPARPSGFAADLLSLVGLADQGWALFLLRVLGVVLGLAANWLVFLWVIARLPRAARALRSAVRAALLGAVGFEVLKQVMTYLPGAASPGRPAARCSARSSVCWCSCTSSPGSCCSSRRGRRRRRENEQEEPAPDPGARGDPARGRRPVRPDGATARRPARRRAPSPALLGAPPPRPPPLPDRRSTALARRALPAASRGERARVAVGRGCARRRSRAATAAAAARPRPPTDDRRGRRRAPATPPGRPRRGPAGAVTVPRRARRAGGAVGGGGAASTSVPDRRGVRPAARSPSPAAPRPGATSGRGAARPAPAPRPAAGRRARPRRRACAAPRR